MTKSDGDYKEATENALLQFIVLPGPTPASVLEASVRTLHTWQPEGIPEPLAARGVLIQSDRLRETKKAADSVALDAGSEFAGAFPKDGLFALTRLHYRNPTPNVGKLVEIRLTDSRDSRTWIHAAIERRDLPGSLSKQDAWQQAWSDPATLETPVDVSRRSSALGPSWVSLLEPARARALGKRMEDAWAEPGSAPASQPRL